MCASKVAGLLFWAVALLFIATQQSRAGSADPILIGQTMPYSGPASSYGTIGRVEAAYFDMINAEGGVNGRKVKLLSLDDGYSPPKAFELTRKLVEQDKVLLIFGTFGTPTNAVIKKYLNSKHVPHLFATGGAVQWNDPQHFPWTFGWQPNYKTEMAIYAAYLLKQKPQARIGILYQNDDVGRDNLQGLKDALGERAVDLILKEVSYESTDSSVESQVISIKEAGADVFFNAAAGKFAAQAIRKAADLNWTPLQFLNNYSSSVATVLKPAGLAQSKGIISSQFQKDPTDPRWKDDAGYRDWVGFMDRYYPAGDKRDIFNVYGYLSAMTLVEVLKRCGDDLSRENIRRQAESLREVALPLLLQGISLNTSSAQHVPIHQLNMMRFSGETWELFGETLE
ncbi:ABC transporter substrate-binding protein [Bradyrhizobium sp. 33ap4]|uniref:ABC transporter substrate-binding protein n=1 Tax=Bradyrhizobium sp. 33ap4 TaxID=3061630 RepID=UPI0029317A25|nr:ABC transporter substrate-binding protein [Bradyrhizobium sp. 33ap4]